MKAFISFVVGALLVVGGAVFYIHAQLPAAGATAGTEHYNSENFYQPITVGGNVLATSSQGTAAYTYNDLINTSFIQQTAAAALTVSLPASSTLKSFIPKPGDTRRICETAITTKFTLAGGTGTNLYTASSTKDVLVGGLGCLTFVRKSNTDISVLLVTGI